MAPSSELDYRSVFERTAAGVFRLNGAGQLIDCNHACARILGYADRDELLARGTFEYVNESDGNMVLATLRDVGSLSGIEIPLRRRDGMLIWVYESLSAAVGAGDEEVFDGIMMEFSEPRAQVERLEYHTQHDPLTELPNRTLFLDRLNVAIARARRNHSRVAALYLDLDYFDMVNATVGSTSGDRVLKRVALRVCEALRIEDSVARYGSDELVMLLTDFGDEENIAIIAQRVLQSVAAPLVLDGHDVQTSASIGVALFPEDGDDAETLVQNARLAMQKAKELGRNNVQFHESALNQRAFERTLLVSSLRRALDNGELRLHFQPEVDTRTGGVACVESLLRWQHPEFGLIEPPVFITAVEESALSSAIGEWVLLQACRQARDWRDKALGRPRIGVNLSRQQLSQPSFLDTMERLLRDSSVDASMLQLEISEQAIRNEGAMLLTIGELKNLGVQLAIDDFGTGRCAYEFLKQVPVDALKVHRSFIESMLEHREDAAIVEAMITMARGLSLRIIAQGVESKDQMVFLQQRSCMNMQGYFFGRPVDAAAVEEILRLQH